MTEQRKLVAVLGATRGQGGSVIEALLEMGRYQLRGITSDADTPDACRLKDRGVEVVATNLDNVDEVVAALATAHMVFAVTTMYDGDSSRETQQGMNIANAAAASESLEHLIWSTLPSASSISTGKIPVPHMDGKARVDEYIIKALPGLARKTTFYWGGFYAENVTYPSWQPNTLTSAHKRIWLQPVGAETEIPIVGDHRVNTGLFVRSMLERRALCLPAQYVLGVTDWLTLGSFLRLWTDTLRANHGQPDDMIYVKTNVEAINQLWPGMGTELAHMLQLSEVFGKLAWSKEGSRLLTYGDLGLTIGPNKGELISTRRALEELSHTTVAVL